MAMLTVGTSDYSANVIAGSYQVIQEDVYVSWTDANYTVHREVTREKISGSFDVYFKTISDYETFLADLTATKSEGHYTVSVKVNNLVEGSNFKEINCWIKMDPTRNRTAAWNDYMERFTITIEEA